MHLLSGSKCYEEKQGGSRGQESGVYFTQRGQGKPDKVTSGQRPEARTMISREQSSRQREQQMQRPQRGSRFGVASLGEKEAGCVVPLLLEETRELWDMKSLALQ